jgi:hypothetical protein
MNFERWINFTAAMGSGFFALRPAAFMPPVSATARLSLFFLPGTTRGGEVAIGALKKLINAWSTVP